MKQLLVLFGCVVFLLGLAGCQNAGRTDSSVGVIIENDGAFPQVMVGVWQAEVSRFSKWGIKFEPDGSILKIVHSLAGPVKLSEGGVYAEGPEGYYYVFAMGPCEANYIPGTGILKVKIIVDHYEIKLPIDLLEGKIEDYFEGPVSEDGKTWKVNWRNYGWLDGADPPDPVVIEANPIELVFTKIDIE